MGQGETFREESGDVEGLHHLRLRALLHGLVRKKRRMGAAEALGIDHRTLATSLEGGALSRRVRVALERLLLSGDRSAAAKQREHMGALEERIERLEKETRGARAAVEGEIKALREEHAQTLRQFERRLAKLETRQEAQGAAEASGGSGKPTLSAAPRREYPELVTKDPAPDDTGAYGDAWPLIDEWRRLWEGHSHQGKGLSWLVTEERIRELEVAMLEEHGLTLPPETQPLHGLWRRSQLNWRKGALYDTRRARARRELLRWVRRVLSLGLWRK